MTSSILKVEVGGLSGKVHLTGKGHTSATVPIDYPEPFGEDEGFTSLELLIISLASCSAHGLLLLFNRSGLKIDDIHVAAVGHRRMDVHPTVLTRIELEYTISGKGLDPSVVEREIRIAEEKICPVWAMLKSSVEIVWKYTLKEG